MPVKALREGWGCPRRPQRTFASSSRGWPGHELQQRRSPAPCCRHSEVRPKGPLLLHGWFVQDFLLDVDRSRRLIEFVTILLLSYFFFWPSGMWYFSFPTRDQTHTSCIGRQSLNHCTAREVPRGPLLLKSHSEVEFSAIFPCFGLNCGPSRFRC